jgi:hypothetical protein
MFFNSFTKDDLELEPIFPLRDLPDATGGQYDHPFLGHAAYKGPGSAAHSSNDTSSDVSYSFIFGKFNIFCVTNHYEIQSHH